MGVVAVVDDRAGGEKSPRQCKRVAGIRPYPAHPSYGEIASPILFYRAPTDPMNIDAQSTTRKVGRPKNAQFSLRRPTTTSKVLFEWKNRRLSSVGREGRLRPLAGLRVVGVDQDPHRNPLVIVSDYRDAVVEDANPIGRQPIV